MFQGRRNSGFADGGCKLVECNENLTKNKKMLPIMRVSVQQQC